MGLDVVDQATARQRVVESLGFDSDVHELTTPEVRAALVRHAASIRCPVDRRRLVATLNDAIGPLVPDRESFASDLSETLESILAHGDLYETALEAGERPLLRLGAPRYVAATPTRFLLLGIRADGVAFLPRDESAQIEYQGHIRTIKVSATNAGALEQTLQAVGLAKVTRSQWLRRPEASSPEDLVTRYDARLVASPESSIDGLQILDPTGSVLYYRGRWRPTTTGDNGCFLARRPQAFGADLWCYTEVQDGIAVRVIDLPTDSGLSAVDEAWWLQAAIDATRRHPQRVRLRESDDGGSILDFFSPVPRWVQRHLDIVGSPCPKASGALFSYAIQTSDAENLLDFTHDTIWTEQLT